MHVHTRQHNSKLHVHTIKCTSLARWDICLPALYTYLLDLSTGPLSSFVVAIKLIMTESFAYCNTK